MGVIAHSDPFQCSANVTSSAEGSKETPTAIQLLSTTAQEIADNSVDVLAAPCINDQLAPFHSSRRSPVDVFCVPAAMHIVGVVHETPDNRPLILGFGSTDH